jgi:MFS family permease
MMLIVFALLFGFASGSNISLATVCLSELCRTEEYGRYYAVVSFGCLTGIPIAGSLISSANGSYWALILFTGSCYVVGLAAFTSARVLAKGWKWGLNIELHRYSHPTMCESEIAGLV